jgi:hypothetical protein
LEFTKRRIFSSSWIVPMKRFCCETCPRSHGRIAQKLRGAPFLQRPVFLAAERLGVAALGLVFRLDVARRLFDEGQREFVAFLVVVGPIDEAVLAHDDRPSPRILPARFPASRGRARSRGACHGV